MNLNTSCTTLTLVITFLLLLRSQKSSCADDWQFQTCVPKTCGGDNQSIKYPFWIDGLQHPFCGFPGFKLSCNDNGFTVLNLSNTDYIIHQISYNNHSVRVSSAAVSDVNSGPCVPYIQNLILPPEDRFELANDSAELFLFFNCSLKVREVLAANLLSCSEGNKTEPVLALFGHDRNLSFASGECGSSVAAPFDGLRSNESSAAVGDWKYYEKLLKRGFELKWRASDCSVCERSGGRCGFDDPSFQFRCFCPDRPHAWQCSRRKENLVLKLTAGICGGSTILLIFLLVFCRYMRRKYATSNFLSGNTCSDSSPKSGLEGGNLYFGVPVFSYHELEEATNNFDSSKELGDGGFGTVYHGKLQDGREVAVKRLYEKSYKRIEQFINEIRILTRLRHQNLVSLYGCTSCHSRELLLVYEFITNGTVADHLHGDLANHRLLTWPIRLNIAIETASALAYLHASEIIHRDVKTNNILLDSNFSVKVADFGLSRLFPADITHVSTAPQGTPGYVDPEYHQCYQLTKKSDVYSFGVVLIELISSMPAVDISRHQNEINLANLALNRIQNKELDELIDPCLGFETDLAVRRMTISVAELAFQCLQVERDARPLMEDVLMALRNIESGDHDLEKPEEAVDTVGPSISVLPPPSPESDDVVGLLKNMRPPPSPDSVTNKWVSGPTTPSTSC